MQINIAFLQYKKPSRYHLFTACEKLIFKYTADNLKSNKSYDYME